MDQNRLVEVHHPSDGLPEERPKTIYHYEDPELVGYLTGITDEKGVRFATWAYNADGRTTSSEHAGGADRVTLAYNPDGSRTVTGPLGQQTIYRYTKIAGVLRLTSVERQATAKVPAATETRTYDANGFIQQLTDFEGNVTTFVHDARGLQTSRTEASGTPEARTITTTWHPTFRLPDVVTEPGRTSDFDYDAQGRMTSVTITDTTGHTVPYSTNGEVRTWTYTYNGSGQVLTIDGPRSDVTDVTTFEYDAQGNRNKVINALGQTTFITAFNGRGLPLTLLDPNDVETELSYNPRGWLVERRVRHPSGDAVTSFDYDDTGQVVTITQPNGARLHYDYDDARRLTAVRNDLGERIDYTLDAMGNRTAETVKSTTGTIKRSQTRIFDELGRLLQSVGAASQTWVYVYDNNNNLKTVTDPATGETQRAFDALDRLIQVTDPALGVAGYGYDARDNLTSVSDQRSLTTAYVHNAFGDVIQTDSPDTGITVYLVDPAGNVTQMTDARGVVANFTYDALDRALTRSYPADATQNVTYGYDDAAGGNYGVGRLTSMTDQSGSAAYRYDHRGNLVEEARTIGTTTFTTGYAYDLADNVVTVTYPSGRIVNYDRDDLGRVAGVTTQENAASVPVTIAADIAYLPFGPMESFTFGNGLAVTYAYDQDYRLTGIDTGGATAVQDLTIGYDGRDNITAITDNLDATRTQGFGYDALSRLTSASGPYGSIAYSYDAVGNRETRDVTVGAVTTSEAYTYALDSNRLLTVDLGGTLRSLTHGASGNVTTDDRGADPDLVFDYDLSDRLVQVKRGGLPLKQYLHNAIGERVVKQAPGGFDPEYFHYDQAGRLLAESDGTGAWPRSYVYLNGLTIAQVEPGSGAGTPIDVILDNGAAGTTPSGTWTASTAGQGFEGADHMLRPTPPEGIDGGILIDNVSPAFTSTASCAASTADPGYEGADYRVCAVDTGVDYAEEVPLTLVNPNAETGDVSGWTSESGTFGIRATNPAPIEGASYFFGGSSGQSRMYQDVAVPAAQQAAVDAGGWFARLTWQQNSYDSKDRGSAILAFLDAGGQPLAPDLESLRRTPGSWSLRELRAAVPPLTRTIRVKLHALRTRGDNNDAYFDDIALSLLRSDSDLRRLSLGLQNGDAETGNTSGWTIEAGGFGPRSANPAPVQGGAYFIAGAAANSRMYQDLAIPAAQIPKVDAGNRSVEVNWRQASYDGKDKGSVILQFLDSGGLAIGADVESDLIAASKYWTDRQLSAAVPAGTRTIRLKLRGQRSNGTNNDAYFDTVTADLLLYGASAGSPPAAAATWRFQVSSSEDYRIYAKWPDGAGLATNASYRVFHALGASTAVTKSQRQGGGGWTLLGTFGLTAGEDHWVELADQANGPVAADAIYLVPSSAPTGSFSWAPSLPLAGDYGVYAKWAADAGRASDAVYGVYHTGGLAEVAQDQRAGAGQWRYLGTYAFDPAGSPLVVLAGGSDGTLSADAIRFVGAGPAPAALRFVHNDHLGTPQKLTDNAGAVVWDRIQTPFGRDYSVTGAAATPVRFPGQYADGESALFYNYFRDYDASLGRYVQSDPIGLAGGLNVFMYANQNPGIWSDRFGLEGEPEGWPDRYPRLPLGDDKLREVSPEDLRDMRKRLRKAGKNEEANKVSKWEKEQQERNKQKERGQPKRRGWAPWWYISPCLYAPEQFPNMCGSGQTAALPAQPPQACPTPMSTAHSSGGPIPSSGLIY